VGVETTGWGKFATAIMSRWWAEVAFGNENHPSSRPFRLTREPRKGGLGGCECAFQNVLSGRSQKYCNVGGDAKGQTLSDCAYERNVGKLWSFRVSFVVGGEVRRECSRCGARPVEGRRDVRLCSAGGRVFSR